MSNLKDGGPTGRLNNDGTLIEVHCYVDVGGEHKNCGTRWIPITDEMKAKIMSANTQVVSMGATITEDMKTRMINEEQLIELEATLLRTDQPTSKGEIYPSEEVKILKGFSVDSFSLTNEGIQPRGHLMKQRETHTKPESVNKAQSLSDYGIKDAPKKENSGGAVNYYSVEIKHPKRPERQPYIFEVQDLIVALNMNFDEGNVLKSLVRSCNEREHGLAKEGGDQVRDAEKMAFSSQELVRIRKLQKEGKL